MSELEQYIRQVVQYYLGGKIDLDDFRVHFVGAYAHAREHAAQDIGANSLASKLMLPYAEFSSHGSEASLRRALANTVRPLGGMQVAQAQVATATGSHWLDGTLTLARKTQEALSPSILTSNLCVYA